MKNVMYYNTLFRINVKFLKLLMYEYFMFKTVYVIKNMFSNYGFISQTFLIDITLKQCQSLLYYNNIIIY